MISCQAAPAARTALPVAAAGGAGGRSVTATREQNRAEPSRSPPLAQPDAPRLPPASSPGSALLGAALG